MSDCLANYRVRGARVRDVWLRNQTTCIQEHLQGDPGYGKCDALDQDCYDEFTLADSAFPNIPVVIKCKELAAKIPGPTSGKMCVDELSVGRQCNALATLTGAARQATESACFGGETTCESFDDCLESSLAY